jgi:hypothetical protein
MTKKAKTALRSQRGALVPRAIRDKREANIPLTSGSTVNAETLLADLRSLIRSARQRVATVANSAQTMLYWHVGRRLLKENLQGGEGGLRETNSCDSVARIARYSRSRPS